MTKASQCFSHYGTLIYKEGSRLRSWAVTQLPAWNSWPALSLAATIAATVFYKWISSPRTPPSDQAVTPTPPNDTPTSPVPNPFTSPDNSTSQPSIVPPIPVIIITPPPESPLPTPLPTSVTPSTQLPPSETPSPANTTTHIPTSPLPTPQPSTTTATTLTTTTTTFTPISSSNSLAASFIQIDNPDTSPNISVKKKERNLFQTIRDHYIYYRSHKTKLMKYPHILNQLVELAGARPNSPANSKLNETTAWDTLVKTLEYTPLESSREQYRAFVEALRTACQIFKNRADPRTGWVRSLAYHYFASVKLFRYCHDLVLHTTDKTPFNLNSLSDFRSEFLRRNAALDNLPDEDSMPALQREAIKFAGTANIGFDPSGQNNPPYVAGVLTCNGMAVTLLRHGIPLSHHDPIGFIAGGVDKLISYVSDFRFKPYVTNPPTVNPDYLTFVEQAGIIFQVILENPYEKAVGDESARVKARVAIGNDYPNFFPIVLLIDGAFFEPENFKAIPITKLMDALSTTMLTTNHGFNTVKVQDHLRGGALDNLLKEVKAIYFSDTDQIEKLEDYQAFIILSYAHIILYLCMKLNPKFLEIFCKDGIDRGNVVQTILKLHFLYLTGQITAENLKNVLVDTLAAPLIVKKQGVILKRSKLIVHTCQRMETAVPLTYKKQVGKVNGIEILQGSYQVFDDPTQEIVPLCCSAQSIESYKDYLNYSTDQPISFSSENLIEQFVAALTVNGKTIPGARDQQISTAFQSLEISFGGTRLTSDDAHPIYVYLCNNNIAELEAVKVLYAIQDQPIVKAHETLHQFFDNEKLKLTLSASEEAKTRFDVTVTNGVAHLTWTAFFKITGENGTIANLKVVIDLPDHRNGLAQLLLSKIN